jgi:hypothetical protein
LHAFTAGGSSSGSNVSAPGAAESPLSPGKAHARPIRPSQRPSLAAQVGIASSKAVAQTWALKKIASGDARASSVSFSGGSAVGNESFSSGTGGIAHRRSYSDGDEEAAVTGVTMTTAVAGFPVRVPGTAEKEKERVSHKLARHRTVSSEHVTVHQPRPLTGEEYVLATRYEGAVSFRRMAATETYVLFDGRSPGLGEAHTKTADLTARLAKIKVG